LANKFQASYRAVEGELRNTGRVQAEEGMYVDGLDTSGLQDTEPVPKREEQVDEAQIYDVLETIEATLCTLLYGRLFHRLQTMHHIMRLFLAGFLRRTCWI